MSYIITGTSYPDPEIACYMTDLEDLQNIYTNKLNNYFTTNTLASEFLGNKQDYAYTVYEIIDILCFNEDNNGLVSVLPLFIYLTVKTKNWTEKIENINNEIITYTEANVNGFNDDFFNLLDEQVLENYPGLLIFVQNKIKEYEKIMATEKPETQPELTPESSFLDQIACYWKNNCSTYIPPIPPKEKTISQAKSLSREEFFGEEKNNG